MKTKNIEIIIDGKHSYGVNLQTKLKNHIIVAKMHTALMQAIPIEPPVMQKIAVVIEDLFKLYEQGDFSNGVECCGMDQGYIHARDYINNLRIDWNKIKAESNFSV